MPTKVVHSWRIEKLFQRQVPVYAELIIESGYLILRFVSVEPIATLRRIREAAGKRLRIYLFPIIVNAM